MVQDLLRGGTKGAAAAAEERRRLEAAQRRITALEEQAAEVRAFAKSWPPWDCCRKRDNARLLWKQECIVRERTQCSSLAVLLLVDPWSGIPFLTGVRVVCCWAKEFAELQREMQLEDIKQSLTVRQPANGLAVQVRPLSHRTCPHL